MHLLTIEMLESGESTVDGVVMDPFQLLDLKFSLIHKFLVSEDLNYELGTYKLVFDLDREQELPNFCSLEGVV